MPLIAPGGSYILSHADTIVWECYFCCSYYYIIDRMDVSAIIIAVIIGLGAPHRDKWVDILPHIDRMAM